MQYLPFSVLLLELDIMSSRFAMFSLRQDMLPLLKLKKCSIVCTYHIFCIHLSVNRHLHTCMLSYFSHVRLLATLWAVAHPVPLPMGFSRQEYWSGLPCPLPGDFLCSVIELTSLTSPALVDGFFTTSVILGAPIDI